VRYRLWGIDAPEVRQTCRDGWHAGVEASAQLRALLVGRKVTFESMSMANWNRPTAKVYADGADVGAAMVRAGMAWAFVRYSRDYVGLEEQARAAVLGVHAHDCEKPWDWRARIRSDR
jgi:endonuclease YncB( thermonuclease family)